MLGPGFRSSRRPFLASTHCSLTLRKVNRGPSENPPGSKQRCWSRTMGGVDNSRCMTGDRVSGASRRGGTGTHMARPASRLLTSPLVRRKSLVLDFGTVFCTVLRPGSSPPPAYQESCSIAQGPKTYISQMYLKDISHERLGTAAFPYLPSPPVRCDVMVDLEG